MRNRDRQKKRKVEKKKIKERLERMSSKFKGTVCVCSKLKKTSDFFFKFKRTFGTKTVDDFEVNILNFFFPFGNVSV